MTHAPKIRSAPRTAYQRFFFASVSFPSLPCAEMNLYPTTTKNSVMTGREIITTTWRTPEMNFGIVLKAELSGFARIPASAACAGRDGTRNEKVHALAHAVIRPIFLTKFFIPG